MFRRWCSLWSAEGADNFLRESVLCRVSRKVEIINELTVHLWIRLFLWNEEEQKRYEMVMGEMVMGGKNWVEIPPSYYSGFCIHSHLVVHAQDQDFFPHLCQNKAGVTLSVFTGPFFPPNHPILAFWTFSSAEAIPACLCTRAHWAFSCPGTPSLGSAFQHCWHQGLQTTFFLAVLLIGDYCSKAALGTSLQSQAGRSTVVLAREVSQLPGSLSPPTLSLNWDFSNPIPWLNLFQI